MKRAYLTELNLDHIVHWSVGLKLCGGLVLLFFTVSLGYLLETKPRIVNYEVLQQEESMLITKLKVRQQQALHFEEARLQLLRSDASFNKLLKQFPLQYEMPSLLEDISKTGITHGLVFELFAPQRERTQGVYKERSIRLVLIGTYHQIASFLGELAEMNRLVTIHDFVLSVYSQEKSRITSSEPKIFFVKQVGLLRMSLLIKVYWVTKEGRLRELERGHNAGIS